jgi:hypothetical protein
MDEKIALEKAKMADEFIKTTRPGNLIPNFRIFKREFMKLTPRKPHDQDPFIDEVCSRRLLNLIREYFLIYRPGYQEPGRLNEIRVSDLPPLPDICVKRGFGRISKKEYNDLIEKYRP